MGDVIEVSYTGDLLAHRRCPRSWAYEKYAGFQPYEQVQAMEGRLIHHAMEWLARRYRESGSHPAATQLRGQLERYFRVLWARGFRTAFVGKAETLDRVQQNLFPAGKLDPTVRAAVEGAVHTEYELRTVKKLIEADFAGKSRMLLTGILDIVVQQQGALEYRRTWKWHSLESLEGWSCRSGSASSKRPIYATGSLGVPPRSLRPFSGAFVVKCTRSKASQPKLRPPAVRVFCPAV